MITEPIDITIGEYYLTCTCGGFPEQYDVHKDAEQVAYLKLRHGHFTVTVPDVGGEMIYSASPYGDGIFYAHERAFYLKVAVYMIDRFKKKKP